MMCNTTLCIIIFITNLIFLEISIIIFIENKKEELIMNRATINEYVAIYSDVLDYLTDNYCDFYDFMCEPKYNDDAPWAYDDFCDGDIRVVSGATRLCVILRNEDYVLKIPFYMKSGTNYCMREVDVYDDAKARGLDMFLAETAYLMDYMGAECYLMKKAKTCDEYDGDIFESTLRVSGYSDEEIEEYYDSTYEERAKQIFLCSYSSYEEEIYEFFDFLAMSCISDLHHMNIGFINGAPVIIDYAGYDE